MTLGTVLGLVYQLLKSIATLSTVHTHVAYVAPFTQQNLDRGSVGSCYCFQLFAVWQIRACVGSHATIH